MHLPFSFWFWSMFSSFTAFELIRLEFTFQHFIFQYYFCQIIFTYIFPIHVAMVFLASMCAETGNTWRGSRKMEMLDCLLLMLLRTIYFWGSHALSSLEHMSQFEPDVITYTFAARIPWCNIYINLFILLIFSFTWGFSMNHYSLS